MHLPRSGRRMVLDAAEKYGYDFSKIYEKQMAKTGTIYFIIYKKHGAVISDTPFFEQVSDGISKECQKQDYKLNITYIFEDEDPVSRQISGLLVSDCSGIILLGTEMDAKDVLPFLELPFPLILLDTYFETISCNCVLINNVQGAYLATMDLIRTYKAQPGYLQSAYQISNFAAVFEPALSTINVAKQYMGAAAAQRLISLIREPGHPPVKTELATTLIRRSSG